MTVFPLFTEVKGRKCIIVGGGSVAYRKILVLLQFEMQLEIIAPEVCQGIEELERQGKVRVALREYSEPDMDGAFIVIAATSLREVNERVYRDAVRFSLPVNVVDDPERCTFIFPSVVKRGDLVIGVSTSGKYPALTKRIRKTLESSYTEEYGEILNRLSDFRKKVTANPVRYISDLEDASGKMITREELLGSVLDELYQNGDITGAAMEKILLEYESRDLFNSGRHAGWKGQLE